MPASGGEASGPHSPGADTLTVVVQGMLADELPSESVTITLPVFGPGFAYVTLTGLPIAGIGFESSSVPLQIYVYPVPLPPLGMAVQTTVWLSPTEEGDAEQDAVTALF